MGRREIYGVLVAAALVAGACFVSGGCAQCQVEVNNAESHGTLRGHQDVARVTSSEQAASVTADVPVSLVPK